MFFTWVFFGAIVGIFSYGASNLDEYLISRLYKFENEQRYGDTNERFS